MFTGIVEDLGRVVSVAGSGRDRRIVIETHARFLKAVKAGDSIACSGVCLTVSARRARTFAADMSVETLGATTAGAWRPGRWLNLEPALTLAKPLGGHLVSGHVDGTGRLLARKAEARSWRMQFSVPRALARYVARKSSICVDGVSLTVNEVGQKGESGGFGVNIVPHTLRQTTLGALQAGDPVNLEVDLIARYLERLGKGTP